VHVITGLLRSGSTLLCNILNENNIIYASHTSIVCERMKELLTGFSRSIEFIGDLGHDKDGTINRLRDSARAFCNTWYAKAPPIVFDKSRG